MLFHVRRQLRPARGNSFYRDRSDRYTGTLCGAEPTSYDALWRDRNRVKMWTHPEHGEMIPCPECLNGRDR
jgi:hypothetical protein